MKWLKVLPMRCACERLIVKASGVSEGESRSSTQAKTSVPETIWAEVTADSDQKLIFSLTRASRSCRRSRTYLVTQPDRVMVT